MNIEPHYLFYNPIQVCFKHEFEYKPSEYYGGSNRFK